MAAKRLLDDSDNKDSDEPNDRRIRPTRPSFASVIGEVVMAKNMQNVFSGLEPLLRRVVKEEVERAIRGGRSISRSPSLRIQGMEQQPSSNLQLVFTKNLSLPIFTGSRIFETDGSPIHVALFDKASNGQVVPTSLPYPLKLQIVVLDGDFPHSAGDTWTSDDFNRHIVRERTGKRPLLAGELSLSLRDGVAPLNADVEFTDNSSWIRSRKFRLAVRVAPSPAPLRIREAITEPFVVKDHRGELYKKHHPPMLHDQVWRLEKIGKDGAFHNKLAQHGINTVQDFLKLSVIDLPRLRKILGIGMSEKMWDVTIRHARTCNTGNKLYVYRGPNFTLFLNAICQMIKADINGHVMQGRDLNNMNRSYIEKLVREAYAKWDSLDEIDEVLNDNAANLLTQGETAEQLQNTISYNQNDFFGDKSMGMGIGNYVQSHTNNSAQIEWPLNAATFAPSPFGNGMPYSFSDPQSDGDITPTASSSVMDGAPRWP